MENLINSVTEIMQHKAVLKVGGILAILGGILGDYYFFFVAFFVLNILDYITGNIKAIKNQTTKSEKGAHGIKKKVMYWVVIGISFGVAVSCAEIGKLIDVPLGFLHLFGYYVLAMYAVNELRSVTENIIEMDVYIPPMFQKVVDFLAKGLEVAAKKNITGSIDELIDND